ncbi:MAG: Fpg/Nei family DNA glycosylase [Verrucomicrobia bacterium]|nr:Fpg/Nei family DNA glycosylase [Verrucomicrobiota bacterium]
MPELAEVELARRLWHPAVGEIITSVDTHPKTRIFRDCPAKLLQQLLPHTTLTATRAHGKRLLFTFSPPITNNKSPITEVPLQVELHLGMSGRLYATSPDHRAEKHDHFLLRTAHRTLAYNDYRQFGGLKLHRHPDPWADLPPQVLDRAFTLRYLSALLDHRPRVALKALLLDQAAFPGVGNWMADEICWRLAAHPSTPVGKLDPAALRNASRTVCCGALRHVADRNFALAGTRTEAFAPGSYVHLVPPSSWLFQHRWKPGGACPTCKKTLSRATIAGRTTAWCPACQLL